jgi:hypothetical protein
LLASSLPGTSPDRTAPTDLATGPNGGVIPIVALQADAATTEVSLADGSVVSLRYPAGSNLADTGYLANASFAWDVRDPDVATGEGCCSRTTEMRHTPRAQLAGGLTPTATYPGADGGTVLWFESLEALGADDVVAGGYLMFAFGDWTMLVWTGPPASDPSAGVVAMSDEERRTWAASVSGETNAEGYLVLTPRAPLSWAATAAPDGQFGDLTLGLYVRECEGNPPIPPGGTGVSLCFPDEGVEVFVPNDGLPVVGDPDVVDVEVLSEGPLFDLAG